MAHGVGDSPSWQGGHDTGDTYGLVSGILLHSLLTELLLSRELRNGEGEIGYKPNACLLATYFFQLSPTS